MKNEEVFWSAFEHESLRLEKLGISETLRGEASEEARRRSELLDKHQTYVNHPNPGEARLQQGIQQAATRRHRQALKFQGDIPAHMPSGGSSARYTKALERFLKIK